MNDKVERPAKPHGDDKTHKKESTTFTFAEFKNRKEEETCLRFQTKKKTKSSV